MKTSKWSNELSLLSQVASVLKLADSVLMRTIKHSQTQGHLENVREHEVQLAEVRGKLANINDELQALSLLHEAAILTGNYTESKPG